MSASSIEGISPFFIVANVADAIDFYCDQLGFSPTYAEPKDEPFFAIVARGSAMIFLKDVGLEPLPNSRRSAEARWDAYLYVPDPDALAAEFAAREVAFSRPLADTEEGLRGFEVTDGDGHVLFFGRPR